MGVIWVPAGVYDEIMRAAPRLHYGEPVIAYDFQIMTDQQLMQVEWRRGLWTDGVEVSRMSELADAELTRRGVHERYC